MMNFMIELPHTADQCMHALDEMEESGRDLLDNTFWGCMAGNHTGWAMVEAMNESDVWNMVPPAVRDDVNIIEVSKFTSEQIRSMHKMAA